MSLQANSVKQAFSFLFYLRLHIHPFLICLSYTHTNVLFFLSFFFFCFFLFFFFFFVFSFLFFSLVVFLFCRVRSLSQSIQTGQELHMKAHGFADDFSRLFTGHHCLGSSTSSFLFFLFFFVNISLFLPSPFPPRLLSFHFSLYSIPIVIHLHRCVSTQQQLHWILYV